MNKVYSCAFLSALDKNTSRVLFHVHVLSSGDETSSSTHSAYITLALIWLLWLKTKTRLVATDGRRGRVLVCWGTRASPAIGCYKNWPGPLLRTSGLLQTRDQLACLHDGRGWTVCPRTCLREPLWSPQLITHIRTFGKDDWPRRSHLLSVLSGSFLFRLSANHSWFFSSLRAIFDDIDMGRGDEPEYNIYREQKNKKKRNWFFYLKAKLLTRFGTKV